MNLTDSPLIVLLSRMLAFLRRNLLSAANDKVMTKKVKNKFLQYFTKATFVFPFFKIWVLSGGLINKFGFKKIIFKNTDLSKEISGIFESNLLAPDLWVCKMFVFRPWGNN